MQSTAPYVQAGMRSAAYGALVGSLLGIGSAVMRGSSSGAEDPRAGLEDASALLLDANMLEAVSNLGTYRSKDPNAFSLIVEGCDSLVELWVKKVAPGDEPHAMHPRKAASHVAMARRGLAQMARSVRADPRSGPLVADFDESEAALAKLLTDYQHNVSLTTMLYLPQGCG